GRQAREKVGGPGGVAGLAVLAGRVEPFRQAFDREARQALAEGAPARQLAVDAEVALDEVDERLAAELARLGPFGRGNPEPLLAAHAAAVRTRVVGQDHLQLTLCGRSACHDAIAFRLADRDPRQPPPLPP